MKENKDISNYINYNDNIIYKNTDYLDLLKYKINTSNDLSIYQTVDEGIENRLKKYIINSKDLNEFILKVKTKRYTYNKLNRMFIHILCDFTKNEAKKHRNIEYIRILGFDSIGQKHLNSIKADMEVKILNKFDTSYKALEIEKRVSSIYSMIMSDIMDKEIKNIPVKK